MPPCGSKCGVVKTRRPVIASAGWLQAELLLQPGDVLRRVAVANCGMMPSPCAFDIQITGTR